jgi:hypothetical protein
VKPQEMDQLIEAHISGENVWLDGGSIIAQPTGAGEEAVPVAVA